MIVYAVSTFVCVIQFHIQTCSSMPEALCNCVPCLVSQGSIQRPSSARQVRDQPGPSAICESREAGSSGDEDAMEADIVAERQVVEGRRIVNERRLHNDG
jgi:hypothetical protein